jgi:hypothetical protein
MELLKYRGLSEEKVEFIYGFLEKNTKDEYFIQEEVTGHKLLITNRVIKETIGWSTGVSDVKEKEGYLGDILKEPISEYSKERVKKSFGIIKKEHNSNNLYIEWNFIKLFEGEECWLTNNLPITHIDRYEIKGNVFENPEMIKKE